ncbi:MAG: hypothetical protein AAF125_27880 [Chloroflexota bacterium]
MNTPSHMLINAAIGKQLEKRGVRPMYTALIVGSFMPDIPLTILSAASRIGSVPPPQVCHAI